MVSAREWLSRPVHHVLIAAYPILYLLANNVGEVDPREGVVPIAVAVGAAVALFLVLRFVLVPARRAALAVSILAALFLMFGHAATAADQFGHSGLPLLVGWLVLGAVLIAIVGLVPGDLRSLTTGLNIGALVLVVPSLVAIGGHLVSEPELFVGGQRADVGGSSSPGASADSPSGTRPRDIYYFILDDGTARPGPWTSTWTCPTGASWTGSKRPASRCCARRARTTAARSSPSPRR